MPLLVSDEVMARVERLDIPFNKHGIDPYGARKEDIARMLTILDWLSRRYFRTTVFGIDNVPATGRVMLVGNHSGGVPIDGMMVVATVFMHLEPPRLAQGMVEKFLNRHPFTSLMTTRTGQLTGLPEHALRMLNDDRVLMVFPEGVRGTAKLYGDRNTLVDFGSGFVRLALETKTPIVPFAFLGGGEAFPTIVNLFKVGRLLGVPYIPIVPWLVPLPRPVPLELYYSEPMTFDGSGNEDDEVIHGYVHQVKQRIAGLIETGFQARRQRA